MKIAVISPEFPPREGGVSGYTALWMEEMRGRGHDLALMTVPGLRDDPGFPVTTNDRAWTLTALLRLRQWLTECAPDVVVVQYVPHAYSDRGGGLWFALLLWALSLSRPRVPFVLNAHEFMGGWLESWRRLPWALQQRIAVLVLARACRCIVVTVSSRRVALRRLARRCDVVVLEIGPTVRPGNTTAAAVRTRGRFNVMSMGMGHPTQEVNSLVAALEALADAGINAELLTVGRLVVDHPRSRSLGYVSDAEVMALMAATDLFAIPISDGVSGRRSSPISALAAGAPLLTTRGTETDPQIFPLGLDWLVPSGDAEAFAQRALTLAQDPTRLAAAAASGTRIFEQFFAWPVVAAKWEAVLREASSESPRLVKHPNSIHR